MASSDSVASATCARLDRARIDAGLSGCACLPSLRTHDSALRQLAEADQSSTSQIAEIIRRDPSLTTRLLQLVNAVRYGAGKAPTNLDEAVFFVGIRQIRQLAMMTQIIEDFQQTSQRSTFPWGPFWRHSIATAFMTHEITNLIQSQDDEIDYVSGLIHDVGKIVMARAFPEHFCEIYHRQGESGGDLLQLEREVLGVDHAELGAMYLRRQKLLGLYVEIVQFHHAPQLARLHTKLTAAVHVSDLLVRHAKVGDSGNHTEVPVDSWLESAAWKILFGSQTEEERRHSIASLQHSMEGIPTIVEGLA